MKIRNGVLAIALTLGVSQAYAGIIGDTINATYYFPNSTTPYSPYGDIPNAIVGSGIEFVAGSYPYPYSYFDIDLSNDGVLITFVVDAPFSGSGQPWESSITFNGIKLTNLTKSFDPSTLSLTSGSRFDWSGNTISLNWQGIHYRVGDQIVINFANVPEPETFAMVLEGLILIGAMTRRRKQAEA